MLIIEIILWLFFLSFVAFGALKVAELVLDAWRDFKDNLRGR